MRHTMRHTMPIDNAPDVDTTLLGFPEELEKFWALA